MQVTLMGVNFTSMFEIKG